MKKFILPGIFLLIVVVTFFSCNDENIYEKARRSELEMLDEYIAENYPGIEPKPSGLYFIELEKGTGDTIKVGDRVQIYYATWTIDSFLIDQSAGFFEGHRYEPFDVVIGSTSTITGLQEGLTYMQPNAKAIMIINSNLAYGQSGSSAVGGFTTLLMEVEVHKVFPYKAPN